MRVNSRTWPGALAILLLGLVPATAAPEDCAAIAAAFAKMGDVPAFHEVIEQDDVTFEATAIGDMLYMDMDGEVTPVPLGEGGRAKLFASVFDVFTVKDCTALADEALDGRNMKVFDYVLPPDGAIVTEAITQRVWIGADDGLPYQATNPTGKVDITYEGVVAPTP